jgi:hypothetical protein
MKNTVLWGLAVLNTLLLCSFVARITPANSAHAQAARPGEYIVIPGEVTGGSAGVVYILDTTNQQLSAVAYDENAKKMVSMPRIDLSVVFRTGAPAGGTGPRR